VLDAFFRDGTSALDAAQFLDTLAGWTTATLAALPEPAQLLARLLACLEDDDRQSPILVAIWDHLWRRLGRPSEPPELPPLIEALTAAALIEPEMLPESGGKGEPRVRYSLHLGIAEAIHATTGQEFQAAADIGLGAFWRSMAWQATQHESGQVGGMITRPGLAGANCLLRQQNWDIAGAPA
jgi:hypothetical protein